MNEETTEPKANDGREASECSALLNAGMADYKAAALQGIANDVCRHTPEGSVIHLAFENGAAWVQLERNGEWIVCPDAADKSLIEQLNDALCVANGWSI